MAAKKTKSRRAAQTRGPVRVGKKRPRVAPNCPRVGFIGAGNMARSLAGGLLASGWPARAIALSDVDPGQRQAVENRLKVRTYGDNNEVVARSQVLVLAVKPQSMAAVAQEVALSVQHHTPLVISIAAGIRTADLQRWLGAELPLVRAMPNTPALIGSGASALYANARASATMRATAESILRSVGVVVWLQQETQLDVVTALSGSGPAYFFLVMEALERAAINAGLDRSSARLLTLETGYGAAKMALEGAEEPGTLRQRVTSPGGTTERALQILEQGNFIGLFQQAIDGATARARELADRFGAGA